MEYVYAEDVDIRMTLNNRLATAAAAMVQSIMSRRRPLVLRPLSPLRKGSIELADVESDIRKCLGGTTSKSRAAHRFFSAIHVLQKKCPVHDLGRADVCAKCSAELRTS